jgi:ornithine cyclodeaminase
MKFMSEERSSAIITHGMAFAAAREALIAAADGNVASFPVVRAHGSSTANRFSVKAGATPDMAGLKVGSFWPGNSERGEPKHNSTILLFDQQVGRIEWVIEAGMVNAYRTAAADAVAADALARRDAEILAIFGTGHQAKYECLAIAQIRSIKKVLVVARSSEKGGAFVEELRSAGLPAVASDAESACRNADIVVTATPSAAPLFRAEWIGPGTHVASMGSDAVGKQELPPALFERARLYCDAPAQAVVIGDFQHFAGDASRIVAIGDVLAGRRPGRTSEDEITVFDSSGIALQDLYVARHLIAAIEKPTTLA